MSEPNPDRGLVIHAGPLAVDVPRSLGYYGGIAVAVGVGLIDPPLALFIGAIPLVKMLMHGNAPQPVRFLGQVFDGAAKPVGGDAEGTVRVEEGEPRPAPAKSAAAESNPDDEAAPQADDTSGPVPVLARTDPAQQAAVREWAAEHGYQLSRRGRIPAAVWEAYDAAH
jgi:Lsr2